MLFPRVAACVLVLSTCGCVAVQQASHPPVPPIPAEEVPAPPRSRTALVWRPGHYDWTGSAYQWTPGAWVERAGHGSLWQDGYWKRSGKDSAWVPAHWL